MYLDNFLLMLVSLSLMGMLMSKMPREKMWAAIALGAKD